MTGGGPGVAITPYTRTVTRRVGADGAGSTRVARVDDPFHGFEVRLRTDAGDLVTEAAATAHRHPWTTCPGALASVGTLVGAPLAGAAARVIGRPVDTTCVHVNDLVWFAAGASDRQYHCEVRPERLTLRCDGDPCLDWPLADYRIVAGRFDGLLFRDPRWPATLDAREADVDEREAVKVARRALAVAMGYYELDWAAITTGVDVPQDVMANSCHTFCDRRVASAVCLVAPPRRSDSRF